MSVVIILFSPQGNTSIVGRILKNKLETKGIYVQLLNTARTDIFKKNNISDFIKKRVGKHKLLCIGSPVYAHHLHYNVKNIIKALPKPDITWGKYAIPFVTYGGINSGIALKEAGILLKKTGRVVVGGMKLVGSHCLTKPKQISLKINKGMPGKESIPYIEKLAEHIHYILNSPENLYPDMSVKFNYQKKKVRIKSAIIFRERLWQRFVYPELSFDPHKCLYCEKCIKICPVQRLSFSNDVLYVKKSRPECIHCASCICICPSGALDFKTEWKRWESLLTKANKGDGPLASNEFPKSDIYV